MADEQSDSGSDEGRVAERPAVVHETADPVLALKAKDIPTRAAGARDLSRSGTPEHIPLLVDRAQHDLSPAVRLVSASAAADILSRCRVPPRSELLDVDARRALLELFRGMDPGVNAGLFPMLGALGLREEGLKRIATGLRDPRASVRLGAAVGLMRLCVSAAVAGDGELEAAVVALFADSRLKPDALAELSRVCAAVGYRTARPAILSLDLGGLHGEMVAAAADAMDGHAEPLAGVFFSDGLDCGEVNPGERQPIVVLTVDQGRQWSRGRDGWNVNRLDEREVRRMFVRRVGEAEAGPAFQHNGVTWYALVGDALVDAFDSVVDVARLEPSKTPSKRRAEGTRDLEQVLLPLLPVGAPALRLRAILLAEAGELEASRDLLIEALEVKRKVPPDTQVLLAMMLDALGDTDGAMVAYAAALSKVKSKKSWYAQRARARLG
jgi:hypothetical protein